MSAVPAALEQAVNDFAAHERVLVATDFDGVLAPIVLDPTAARPLPGTVETLTRLAALPGVFVAIASGRDLATLRRLTGLEGDVVTLIGSHGAESNTPLSVGEATASGVIGPQEQETLTHAESALAAIQAEFPTVRIEHKPAGVVLHTRGLPETVASEASARALDLPRRIPGLHAMRGKSVVELTVLDVSKGAALTALAHRFDASATAYFGDDVTDETAFEVFPVAAGNLTVKVGEGETAAGYRVQDCHDVPTILHALEATLAQRL